MSYGLRKLTAFFLLIQCFACTNKGPATNNENKTGPRASVARPAEDWTFKRTSGSTLEFANGKGLNTKLYNLKYIGQISNGDKVPFFIYSGSSCKNCDAGYLRVYIHSPDSPVKDGQRGKYRYPGTLEVKGKVLYRSRVFYGQVLRDRKGLIIYLEQYVDDHTMRKTGFSVRVDSGTPSYSVLSDSRQISETLELVKEGKCKEIEGITVKS